MRKGVFIVLLSCAGSWSLQAMAGTTWRVDPGPSSVQFKVRHLLFSEVEGSFRRFSGEVVASSEDFSGALLTTTIPVDSIYTRHPDRDNALKGQEFFWASKYPEILFQSTSVVKTDDRVYEVIGDLTIRGVTRPIALKVEFQGQRAISMGRLRADFRATGSLNRFDYGLTWNEVMGAGRALVGETVDIELDIALIKQDRPADAGAPRHLNR